MHNIPEEQRSHPHGTCYCTTVATKLNSQMSRLTLPSLQLLHYHIHPVNLTHFQVQRTQCLKHRLTYFLQFGEESEQISKSENLKNLYRSQ